MTLDAILNIFLLFTYASDAIGALKILVLSNLGYVFCHVMAMSGFALLRKDRPNWPRPIKLSRYWIPVGIALAAFDLLLLVVGASNAGVAYGQSTRSTLLPALFVLACALGLYVYRVVVQDKRKLALRLWAPTMPDDVPPEGAAIE